MTTESTTTAAPGMFGVLFKRAFSPDLSPGTILPDEATALDVVRVHAGSEPLKRVLLWRRAAIFTAFLFLVPSTFIHLIRDFVGIGKGSFQGTIAGLTFIGTLASVGLCIGAWSAFKRWEVWGRSRRVLFWTWLIAFLTPFLVALIPYGAFATGADARGFGVVGGMLVTLTLAPKALSLVPGVLRAAITTKALFPGSAAPGWLILLATPFYMLLLFVVMLMPYQFSSGGLMALALFCFLGAPIFLIRAGKKLVAPQALEPALETIRATRMATAALNGAGGLFLFIGLINLVSTLEANPLDAIAPILGIVANVFVLGVIGVDTMLVTLMRNHVPHEDPAEVAARDHYKEEMSFFIAAQAEAQPDVVSTEQKHIDFDQPTEPGSRR